MFVNHLIAAGIRSQQPSFIRHSHDTRLLPVATARVDYRRTHARPCLRLARASSDCKPQEEWSNASTARKFLQCISSLFGLMQKKILSKKLSPLFGT
jgi:hypothetical protein